VSGPEIASGVIVFENGKITAVGADAPIPQARK
jgi:imidazolonepropionase-like amidohydrolase